NFLIVLPGSTTSGGLRMGAGSVTTLTYEDARAIAAECSEVVAAAPTLMRSASVVYGGMNWSTLISGTTPEYQEIRGWETSSGRFFTQQEVDGASKVCLLGQTVARNLFGDIDPVGETVRIKRIPFLVIGALVPKGQSPGGVDQDDVILVPLTAAQKRLFGLTYVGAILAQAADTESMAEAESQIRELLRQRHRIFPGGEEDFTVRNLTEVMAAAEQSVRVMSLLLGSIASVSLLVGGIGIMNIMLVSVTERIREIGLRMAVGARPGDILSQFLIESAVLSVLGGLAGILVGGLGSKLITHFATWPTLISAGSILLAFAFSVAVGIFFGYYPARRASRLNPIEALRHE
ncbi:MAG: ABC transporter permease, partial [candidate division NC10 bacterium]|nr:ABC transporter permease [candidate division NC10 bacterium]